MKLQLTSLATLALASSLASAAQVVLFSEKTFGGDLQRIQYQVQPGFCTCISLGQFDNRAKSAAWDPEEQGAIGFYTTPNCQGGEHPTWPLKTTDWPLGFTDEQIKSGISSVRVCRT
ncbi:hypothetical protein GQ42DRAFT_154623 [Ramicandelaber brevisporus]|nr:hypothetical protein GQ42DRAFT_154623 [Ramicandelaber brevisporus]